MAGHAYWNMLFPSTCRDELRNLDGTKEAYVVTSKLAVPRPAVKALSDTYPANPLKHYAVVVLDRTSNKWFKLERTVKGVGGQIVNLGDIVALSMTPGHMFEAEGRSLVHFLDSEGPHGYNLLANNCQVFSHNFWKKFVSGEKDFQEFFEWVGSMPECDSFETAIREGARRSAGTIMPMTLGPHGRKLVEGDVQPPPVTSDFISSKKIVVFGLAGTGKSSMINAVTGGTLSTGGGVTGVTSKHVEVEASYPIESGDRINLSIFDTVGLDEPKEGTVASVVAVDTLIRLFRSISGGINLLVFVLKKGRTLSKEQEYYKMFAEDVGDNRVPILAVVTGCEDRGRNDGLQSWLSEKAGGGTDNRERLRTFGIAPTDIVCTSFVGPESRSYTSEDHDDSVRLVLEKIHKLSNGPPIVLCGQSLTERAKFIYRSTNRILQRLGRTFPRFPDVKFGVPQLLVDMYMRAGADKQTAEALASNMALGKKKDTLVEMFQGGGKSEVEANGKADEMLQMAAELEAQS